MFNPPHHSFNYFLQSVIDLTGLDGDDEAEDDTAVTVEDVVEDVVEDPPGTLKFVYFLPRPLTETLII